MHKKELENTKTLLLPLKFEKPKLKENEDDLNAKELNFGSVEN